MEAGLRVALVVGGGKGIGRATAVELARRGWRVAIAARTAADLSETAQLAGPGTFSLPLDATDPAQVAGAVAKVVKAFGRIDALVNSAGLAPMLSIEQTTPEDWRRILDANLSSPFYTCQAVWDIMKKQQGGAIVNVSSLSARDPFPGFLAYGSAKAGLNLFGLALAREGKPHNIRVHTVAPGAVETQMLRALFSESQLPTSQTLSPEEVARTIVGCIEGDLRYTSGEVVYVAK